METHPNSEIVEKYKDEYTYFFRNLFCDSENKFDLYNNGLFSKPNYKELLEKYFNIKL